jgi:hypothetical protein
MNRYVAYLLDPLLARAAAAEGACRVADLATALHEVLEPDGAIVSWSEFDRNVVMASDLPESLKQRCAERWVNALTHVRRWRNRLYPEWELPTLDSADGHALKVYMKAVGYQVPRALAAGQAAGWLRHVLQRLEANGGNYRKLSKAAKRHWHSLLEYNRHDCAGMRAVYERARRELELETAYRETTFCADINGTRLPIRIGRPHGQLDAALRASGARRWACITAYNPQSEMGPAFENQRRDVELKQTLQDRAITSHPAEGLGDDGKWPAEPGVLALDVSRGRAEALGREFGQTAIVWGRVRGKAELVWCNQLRGVTRRVRTDRLE